MGWFSQLPLLMTFGKWGERKAFKLVVGKKNISVRMLIKEIFDTFVPSLAVVIRIV